MPNTGIPSARASVAEYVSKEQETALTGDDIIMTCGAAGALNVIFKTILDPGDEVIVPAPYFVEYNFYADNHGGSIKTVKTNPDFTLDLAAIEGAISEKTKAVLINSPNNPTGQIYSRDSLEKLGKILKEKASRLARLFTFLLTNLTAKLFMTEHPFRLFFLAMQIPSSPPHIPRIYQFLARESALLP